MCAVVMFESIVVFLLFMALLYFTVFTDSNDRDCDKLRERLFGILDFSSDSVSSVNSSVTNRDSETTT